MTEYRMAPPNGFGVRGKPAPLVDRISKLVHVETGGGCWLWTGKVNNWGYASMTVRRSGRPATVSAHRASYEAHVGPIPRGLELDHLCRVRHCVNPDHLEPVTRLENARRMGAARRQRREAAKP